MKWVKKVPTKPGIYLRKNPVVSSVVRQDVFTIMGPKDLCISNGETTIRLKQWIGVETLWWYGPIPEAPKGD